MRDTARSTWNDASRPVLVGVCLEPTGGIYDILQLYRIAEGVLIQLGHPIQDFLPAAQLLNVGIERDSTQVSVFLDQVTNSIVQPLPRVPVGHIDRGEEADPVQEDAARH